MAAIARMMMQFLLAMMMMVMMLLLLLRVGLVELRQGIFGNSIFEPAFGPPLSPFPFFLRLLPPLLFKEAKIETAITRKNVKTEGGGQTERDTSRQTATER